MRKQLKLTALALGLCAAGQSMAADLTVVSFGGANKAAQVKAFYEPWEKAGKGKIVAGEYNGEMAKVKAMVDTNSVSWNLVEVESPELARGCDEGMFEELDPALFGNESDYVKGAIQPCGVGFFVWSTASVLILNLRIPKPNKKTLFILLNHQKAHHHQTLLRTILHLNLLKFLRLLRVLPLSLLLLQL